MGISRRAKCFGLWIVAWKGLLGAKFHSMALGSGIGVAPFRRTHDAVRFALAFVQSPVGSAVWGDRSRPTDALARDDALAQAGMVTAALAVLGPTGISILSARVLPRSVACHCGAPCCSRRRPNFDWNRAVERVAGEAFREMRIRLHPALARALVVRAYSRGPGDAAMAETHGVAVELVGHSGRAFRRWLLGGGGVEGAEPTVWLRADARLRELGVVGDD